MIRFSDFVLDRGARQVTRRGLTVPLSPKALQLLELLIEARPNVVSKEKVIEALWPDVIVEEANVRNLIAELRAALADNDRDPKFIRTAHRLGYAFIGSVMSAPRRLARLIDKLHTHFLADGINVAGRDPSSEIPLVTTGVSRRHAQFTLDPGRIVVEDLGSKNGTWVNKRRIDAPVELRDGDEIRIGLVTLILRTGSEEGPTSTIG